EHFTERADRLLQTVYGNALAVITRIAAGRQDHTQAGPWIPVGLGTIQFAGQGGLDQFDQAALQAQHDRLGLRVAKPAVEFDYLGCAGWIDHQAGIQEAGIDVAFGRHAANGWPDHLIHHPLVYRIGDDRGGGVGAHAAGVGAGVAVADPLVVLAGGHGQYVLPVDHDDEAGFLALQKLLDYHPRPGFAEGVASQHVGDRGLGFLRGHGDDHALARRQAVGLDDDGGTLLAQVGQGRLDFGEVGVGGGGNGVAGEEILGEGLRAFHVGGAGGGAVTLEAALVEPTDHASHQRGFRPGDRQRDVGGGKVSLLVQLQHVVGDVFALGFGRRASVAGCDKYLLDALILRYFPRQCVLTPATADNQYVHLSFLRRMRSFSQPIRQKVAIKLVDARRPGL